MDLPGYGFANVPSHVRARWPEMIEGYLLGRQNLHAVVALIDAEVGPTNNDTADAGVAPLPRAAGQGRRHQARQGQALQARQAARRSSQPGACSTPKDVLWVSSAKNVNIDELRRRIVEWLDPVDDSPRCPRRPPARSAPPRPPPAESVAGPSPTTTNTSGTDGPHPHER